MQQEVVSLKDYVRVLEAENKSRRVETHILHEQIEKLSTECQQMRRISPSSQMLIQKQAEIQILKQQHDGWVTDLKTELDEFKIKYGELRGEPTFTGQSQAIFAHSAENAHLVTYEQTTTIVKSFTPTHESHVQHEQVQSLRQQVANLTQQLNHQRNRYNEEHRQEVERLRQQQQYKHLIELQTQRREAINSKMTLQNELQTIKAELARATKNNGANGSPTARVYEPIRISAGYRTGEEKTEIEQLKASKLSLQSQLQKLNSLVQQHNRERVSLQQHFNQNLQRLHDENDQLRQNINQLRVSADQANYSHGNLQTSENRNSLKQEELRIRIQQEEKAKYKNQIFKLVTQLATRNDQLNSLSREIVQTRSRSSEVQARLQSQVDWLNRRQLQIQNIQRPVERIDARSILNQQSQINQLVGSINALREEFNREKRDLLVRISELTYKQNANADTIFNLTSELERHLRMKDEGRQSEQQIARLRQELSQLKEFNYRMKMMDLRSNQQQQAHGISQQNPIALLSANKQLERRVYALENANYRLSQKLTQRYATTHTPQGYAGISQTINQLKQSIQSYRQSHHENATSKLNKPSYQAAVRREIDIPNRQSAAAVRKSVLKQTDSKMTHLKRGHIQSSKLTTSQPSLRRDPSPSSEKRGLQVTDLDYKLQTIRQENMQLKRSLAVMHIISPKIE